MLVLKRKKPLCFFNNKILLGDLNKLVVLDSETLCKLSQIELPYPISKRILGKIKLLARMLRLGVVSANFFNEYLYLAFNNRIYEINPKTLGHREIFIFPRGRGPLYFSMIEDILGFEDGLYFGEYFSNPKKRPVDIFAISRNREVKKIYTFSQDLINHVHNIIPDIKNKCVWILTGDFENAAGIWRTEDNFQTFEPIALGSQSYRSCVAFPIEEGLLYATDSQLEKNQIRLLRKNEKGWLSQSLSEINGSCIYGCKVENDYVFSTSTEPDFNRFNNNKLNLFDRKRGPGIIKDESHIIRGNLEVGFRVIEKKKKDFFPYRLFQFGTIYFPSGENPTNKLFSYSIANIGNDLDTEIR